MMKIIFIKAGYVPFPWSGDPMKKHPALDEAGLQRAISQLRRVVREKGLRASAARERVARAALLYGGHFTVEDLVRRSKDERLEETHASTVYRTLPLLLEAGLVEEIRVHRDEGAFYERAFEREHHDHLVCLVCGAVVEFHSDEIEEVQREVAASFGFVLTGHSHELRGTCTACRERRRA